MIGIINISADTRWIAKVSTIARTMNMSRSELIRRAVDSYLMGQEIHASHPEDKTHG